MQTKKYIVLGVLFILPLSMYIFFASGTNNSRFLPVLTEGVREVNTFKTAAGDPVALQSKITVLGFFGNEPQASAANAFNLTHKIYKKYREFEDFQFLILMPNGTENEVEGILAEISEIANTDRWVFAFGAPEAIDSVFASMKTDYLLSPNKSTPYVFIIDKDRSLRGRTDDEDDGILQGFDARDYSEINNKMDDDVKIVLREYRLALKKNNRHREL